MNKLLLLILLSFAHYPLVEASSVFYETKKQIKKIYSKTSKHSYVDFLSLDIIKSETKFIEFIKELVENKNNILYEIGAYYHPAGFIKLVLYKGKKGEQLRFHFWGKGGNNAIKQAFNDGWEPIHNHRWNFSSKIIKGGLDMREYFDADSRIRFDNKKEAKEEKEELNKSYKIYDVCLVPTRKSNGDDYKIIKTGKFAIIGNYSTRYMQPNSSYYIDHRIPHQVKPDFDTATLLLIDPPSKLIASEIFIDEMDQFQEQFELQDLSPEETQKYLGEFLNSF